MDIQSMIVSEALSQGVDPNLALAVAQQESGFNQNAVSSAGAIGVMQLMPATAAGLGVDPNDVTQNIHGGVMLLGQLLGQFGDVGQALAGYNWSPSRVAAAVANYGASWLTHAPGETQNYVASILGRLGVAGPVTSNSSTAAAPSAGNPSTPSWLSTLESDFSLVAAVPNSSVPGWVAYAGLAVAAVGLLLALRD